MKKQKISKKTGKSKLFKGKHTRFTDSERTTTSERDAMGVGLGFPEKSSSKSLSSKTKKQKKKVNQLLKKIGDNEGYGLTWNHNDYFDGSEWDVSGLRDDIKNAEEKYKKKQTKKREKSFRKKYKKKLLEPGKWTPMKRLSELSSSERRRQGRKKIFRGKHTRFKSSSRSSSKTRSRSRSK